MTNKPLVRLVCLSLLGLMLAACAAPGQGGPAPSPTPTAGATLTASATPTPSVTLTATATPTVTPTLRPTITPPPSELDDHPAKPLPVALEPGGFLSWRGSVEALVDDQDWLAIYVAPGAESDVTFDLELQCGGGDTARVGLFEAGVTAGVDSDGNGRLSYEEALETGTTIAGFEMGCLQEVSATVPGGADYYLVVYAAFGGQTGYALYASRQP